MKNKILITIFLLLLLPINAFANENKISINCDKYWLKNNDEILCKINAENINFVTTNITGQIKVSENLEIIQSNYDDSKWKIFDSNFDVKDINLISENKNIKENYTIATFKVKAKHKEATNGKIQFVNVVLGDENYEDHNIIVDDVTFELKYDNKNEETNNNPQTSDIQIIIPIICLILLLSYSIFLFKQKKK